MACAAKINTGYRDHVLSGWMFFLAPNGVIACGLRLKLVNTKASKKKTKPNILCIIVTSTAIVQDVRKQNGVGELHLPLAIQVTTLLPKIVNPVSQVNVTSVPTSVLCVET